MVVHMRHTRAHRDNRRSHHALEAATKTLCPKCKTAVRPHTLCMTCGTYKGIELVDVLAKTKKSEERRKKKEETRKVG